MSAHSVYSGPTSTDSFANAKQEKSDDIRQMVENQDRMASAKGGWAAVLSGNIDSVMKLYPGEDVYERGRYGENVFLLAMSLATPQSITIAKYLAKAYGKRLIRTPYQTRSSDSEEAGPFEGQTALHLAIINGDMEMCKYLINMGADVRARTIGSFFSYGGNAYYGEYPLHFASSLGNKDVALLLRRHGAVPTDKDTQGNSALHLAVMHGQLEMYDYLVDVLGANESDRNRQGLTPLMVAAHLGDAEMFRHIYSKRIKVAWRYGKIHSFWIPLEDLDVTSPSEDQEATAFGVMIRTGQLHLLKDPVMQKIFESKLRRVAPVMVLSSCLHLLLLITITFLVDKTINGARTGVILALHIIVVCYAAAQLLQSLYLFFERTWRTSRYLQEQVERTGLVPVFTGQDGAVEGTSKVTAATTRRATHSHRKSFEVPKQVAIAIKTSIAMGFQGAIGGRKAKKDKAELMALSKMPTNQDVMVKGDATYGGPPTGSPQVVSPPPSPPPSPPSGPSAAPAAEDEAAGELQPLSVQTDTASQYAAPQAVPGTGSSGPSSAASQGGASAGQGQGQGSSNAAPSGGYQNRTRVVKRRQTDTDIPRESAAGSIDGPSTSPPGSHLPSAASAGAADSSGPSSAAGPGSSSHGDPASKPRPSRFASNPKLEGEAGNLTLGLGTNLQGTVIKEDVSDTGRSRNSEIFPDAAEGHGGHSPLTHNKHSRLGLFLQGVKNEMYFSAFEISLWVELAFYIMVIVYFIYYATQFSQSKQRAVNTPGTRVLLALFTLFGWISGLFVLRIHPALSRMLAIIERVTFIVLKIGCLYVFTNVAFALAFFSLKRNTGGHYHDTVYEWMLTLVDALFSMDHAYDLTAFDGISSHVLRGFILLMAFSYYFLVVLLGMTLLRSVLAVEELKGDRGDRDESYWHYHVGMNLLRIWSGTPKFLRAKMLLGDLIRRPDGSAMRFLQYVEGASGYKGGAKGSRRSRDTGRANRRDTEERKRARARGDNRTSTESQGQTGGGTSSVSDPYS